MSSIVLRAMRLREPAGAFQGFQARAVGRENFGVLGFGVLGFWGFGVGSLDAQCHVSPDQHCRPKVTNHVLLNTALVA